MRQVEYVEGITPEEFSVNYNATCQKISRLGTVVDHHIISATKAHIFYEFTDAEEEDKEEIRYCCECENYDWGRGCPYREGHIKLMDHSCEYFNIHPEEVQS